MGDQIGEGKLPVMDTRLPGVFDVPVRENLDNCTNVRTILAGRWPQNRSSDCREKKSKARKAIESLR